MLFNSLPFVVLVGVTFTLFYLPPLRRAQTRVLIVASLVFYAYGSPWLLLLLLVSVLTNSLLSWLIATESEPQLASLITAGVLFNLSLIVLFKYGGLAARSLDLPDRGVGHALATMPLPIGISFYTFENISLLVDAFRRRRHHEPAFIPKNKWRHLEHTTLFVAFFPHLISGPILKADRFYPQITIKRFQDINWPKVFKFCVLGYFLKMVVADNLKDTTGNLMFPQFLAYSPVTLLALLFGFSMQIFADFAGYSLIAVGVALLFGYLLPDNFNFPYVAASLGEFWRRWHISLSTWLREYLYYPLGGNRKGRLSTYRNLFIVMALGGLWHGAVWSFALWGVFHGGGLALERWLEDRWPGWTGRLPRALRLPCVFGFVTLGWLLFKLTDIRQVMEFMWCLAINWHLGLSAQTYLLLNVALFSTPVLIYHAAYAWLPVRRFLSRHEAVAYGAMLAALVLNPGLPGAFLYFQF